MPFIEPRRIDSTGFFSMLWHLARILSPNACKHEITGCQHSPHGILMVVTVNNELMKTS